MDEIINPEEEEMDEMFSKWDNMSQEEKVLNIIYVKKQGKGVIFTIFHYDVIF